MAVIHELIVPAGVCTAPPPRDAGPPRHDGAEGGAAGDVGQPPARRQELDAAHHAPRHRTRRVSEYTRKNVASLGIGMLVRLSY